MADCEWNPWENREAITGDRSHGEATVSVGAKGLWHLCATCAALPCFAIYRHRRPLRRIDRGAVARPEAASDAESGEATRSKL